MIIRSKMNIKAATYVWNYLSGVYCDAGAPTTPKELNILQASSIDHMVLMMTVPSLFFEDDTTVIHGLIEYMAGWIGAMATIQTTSSRIPFFTRVWEELLEHHHEHTGTPVLLPPETPDGEPITHIPHTSSSLVAHFIRSIGMATVNMHLVHPNHLLPLHAVSILASIPTFARQLVTFDQFIHPWVNGFLIEGSNILGVLFRGTTLPDDPAVGDKYFSSCFVNGQPMPDMERIFVMKSLDTKLDAMYHVLTDIVDRLLGESSTSLTRFGMISWLSLLLLSNWSRTKLRATRRQTSNDGFLLNIGAVLLRLGARRNFLDTFNFDEIDRHYGLCATRLEWKDETKIAASGNEESAWMNGEDTNGKFAPWTNPTTKTTTTEKDAASSSSSSSSLSGRIFSSSVASPYFSTALQSTHHDIICDMCRTRNFTGSRNKCAQCKDYDLCDGCATKDYAESLQLIPKSGVLFRCPYIGCSSGSLTEYELRSHVRSNHSIDPQVVACPVCVANNDGRPLDPAFSMYANPYFIQHMEAEHGSSHDPKSHVLIKCPKTILHVMHRRMFNPVAPFEFDTSSSSSSSSSSNGTIGNSSADDSVSCDLSAMHLSPPATSPLPATLDGFDSLLPSTLMTNQHEFLQQCARTQSQVIHTGVTCARCKTKDIRGVHFRCAQCADYSLCQTCGKRDRERERETHVHRYYYPRIHQVFVSCAFLLFVVV